MGRFVQWFSFAAMLFCSFSVYAVPLRLGSALGVANWGGFVYGSADAMGLFRYRMSLGGDVAIVDSNVLLEPRLIFWQKGDMSGLYAGPKFVLGPTGPKSTVVGLGGLGGWSYRFPNGLDAGGEAQLVLSNKEVLVGFSANVGVMLP